MRGSFFRTILDIKFLSLFSSISYGVYLVHGLLILYISGTKTYDTYLSVSDEYVQVLSVLVLSVFFGGCLTFLVELPCRYLSKGLVDGLLSWLVGGATKSDSLLSE